jgi:hypothetical protein
MKHRDNILMYVYLIVAWFVLLVLQHFAHLYWKGADILVSAIDGLTALPIIVLVVVFLMGVLMENRDKRARKQQLMFLKSCMFRLEMRNLYIANFRALKSPALTFFAIRAATLTELKQMREEANAIEYRSVEAIEPVIMEYANAQDVWRSFMNMALANRFEAIFQDMLYVMHFISDVKLFKEINPEKLFIQEAAKNEALMQKVLKIVGDGIRKYLEYAIELKEKQPELFDQVIADYELSTQIRG